jgi:uncharacterized protein (TIGR02246 family)
MSVVSSPKPTTPTDQLNRSAFYGSLTSKEALQIMLPVRRAKLVEIGNMKEFAHILWVVLLFVMPASAFAGPAEDASAVVDRWSAAYSTNDPEEVVRNYWPDALLFGTVSPIMSEGTNAIGSYFARLKGSGNKNVIGEKRTIILGDAAVVVAGFYEFTLVQEGKLTPFPGRFTMLVTKRDGVWHIAHHHSSPLVLPKK